MKKRIDVTRGEIMAGQGEVILSSYTENACLVIAAYDPVKKIGCLGHAIFPEANGAKRCCASIMRDINEAVDEIIKDMVLMGSLEENIEIALVTGENVPHEKNDPGYINRIDGAMQSLRNRHLKCRENTFCDAGRAHVALDVASGKIVFE